jgi:hypothetical protein
MVSPGRYRIDLIDGLKTHSTETEILADPRILETGISRDDLKKQERLSLQIQRLYTEAREFETFIKEQITDNKTSLAIEELRAIQSEITTAAGRYPQPRLISQISYLYSMMDRADQLPGRDAYHRYGSLNQQLEALKKRAGVPGIMD